MRIEFNIVKSNTQWGVTTHQMNSDILLRNVLTKGKVSDLNLQFSYDEHTSKGTIANSSNQIIGDFLVSF